MKWITKKILVVGVCLILGSCEDLLEEPDISNQQVQLLAPTDGSLSFENQVSFSWNGSMEDVDAYRVQLAQPNFQNASQILIDSVVQRDTLGNVRARINAVSLLNGVYEWRVKGLNGGFETSYTTAAFTVDGDENADFTPPNTPQLSAPLNGTVLDDPEINFEWNRVDVPGTAERDSIYIYTDEALQMLQVKGLGANKSFSLTLSANTYYWVVQAFDAAGNRSADSEVFEFTLN